MTVLVLKNGWTDYAEIWYTDRDQLLLHGAVKVNGKHPHAVPQVQGSTSRSPLKPLKIGWSLKETVHLQKNVTQIIFKQILYLKCEE